RHATSITNQQTPKEQTYGAPTTRHNNPHEERSSHTPNGPLHPLDTPYSLCFPLPTPMAPQAPPERSTTILCQ
ncbi:Hypothetical predicted protein, partial [Pelobates cultripes]